ncbi:MAG: sensor histidine kinase, partial [Chloroflexota bacterium]|nr:sensor histidine kinase [Chloroflexota bacterium]
NVHTDARVPQGLRQMQSEDRRPALAMIPLMVRGGRIGLVILSYGAVHVWPEADLHSYQITAAQLATALDSRQQISLLGQHNQQLAVWEERRRLARELHDSVTQLLFSMTLIAQTIGPAWRRNTHEGEQRVGRLLELSQAALAEMRALLIELRPAEPMAPTLPPLPGLAHVQAHGVVAALRRHFATLDQDELNITLDVAHYVRQPPAHEATLFRITQEALNNIVKHAGATQVQICLAVESNTLNLTIQDNGVGFRLNAHQSAGTGFGLQTMHERAVALNGNLQIITAPGQGTMIRVVLPM